jgi:SAM-dependent methyltransferase
MLRPCDFTLLRTGNMRQDEDTSMSGRPADGALTMGSITGKLVLSMIRGSDYAHAGEAEAIDLVLGSLPLTAQTRLLDVGCGIGGTARYVHELGWGTVTGVDIDPDNIDAATSRHPGIEFICSDAARLAQWVTPGFDVIYSFNAFFLFADQPAALRAMREVAAPDAALAIFDYVDRGGYAQAQSERGRSAGLRKALKLKAMPEMLARTGWALERTVSADADYLRWYEDLVVRIELMHDEIVAASSDAFFEFVLERYTYTRDDVRAGRLGGATLYATTS